MATNNTNIFKIEGTIYAKQSRKVSSEKKRNELKATYDNKIRKEHDTAKADKLRDEYAEKLSNIPDFYEFKSIILELKREHKGKTYTELPEFNLGYGVTDDGFDEGDYVQVTFSLAGKEISSTFHKTELKALYIKHPDLDSGTIDVGGEPYRPPKVSKIPDAPDPLFEDTDDSDLPF